MTENETIEILESIYEKYVSDCPICGNTIKGINKPFGNYCSHCGQAIQWKM